MFVSSQKWIGYVRILFAERRGIARSAIMTLHLLADTLNFLPTKGAPKPPILQIYG
jgi:hypothetical protein